MPKIAALPEPQVGALQGCQVRATGSSQARGELVLAWTGTTASMQIDGQPRPLVATEARCTRDCVGPGKSGVRVFLFRNQDIRATLRKRVFCHRDAEVCGGLPAGQARLEVETANGTAVLAVQNSYCDL